MENNETVNNESIVDTNNGAQNQIPDRYNRQVIRAVANGKVSVSLDNAIREKYGSDIANEYKKVLEDSTKTDNKDPNRRKSLINLSAIIRQRENPKPSEEENHEQLQTVEKESTKEVTNETNKDYYLRILQRRIDLIREKYGIEFDPKLIEYFKSDEYFENGNIDFLESYES